MANTIVPWERLLHVSYLPPYVYEDGTHDGEAIVTALFEEPTVDSDLGYAIREYSLSLRRARCSTASPRRVATGAGR